VFEHPKRWGDVLHDDDLADAIVDRILERGRLLRLDGPSIRVEATAPIETATVASAIPVPEAWPSAPETSSEVAKPATARMHRTPRPPCKPRTWIDEQGIKRYSTDCLR